jgi:hypothetical protein
MFMKNGSYSANYKTQSSFNPYYTVFRQDYYSVNLKFKKYGFKYYILVGVQHSH